MAAETDAPPRSQNKRTSGGNVFTRKIGPLPMWAWLAIVSAVILGYAWYKNRQSGSSTASQSSTANASQVPQFVNQTYTTVQPPTDPITAGPIAYGPQGPQGPPGPAGPSDDDTTKKKPANRKHPTHDASQDTRQEARQDARQEARQDTRQAKLPTTRAPVHGGPVRIPSPIPSGGFSAKSATPAATKRKDARIAARRAARK